MNRKSDIKTVLITGNGLIGERLAKCMRGKGYKVLTLDVDKDKNPDIVCDLSIKGIHKILYNIIDKPDLIIHTAAWARVYNSIIDPNIAFDNCRSTDEILQLAKLFEAKVMVTSSREVYGNSRTKNITNEDMSTLEAESPYTASKVYQEAITHAYSHSYNMEYIIVRLSNVFGEEEVFPNSDRVIPLTIAYSYLNHPIILYNKNKCMNFTYVQDAIDGIIFLIDRWNKCKNDTYNIASEQNERLIDVMKYIIKSTKSKSKIKILNNRRGEVINFKADLSKIKSKGWKPKYDIYHMIDRCIMLSDKSGYMNERCE